MQDDAIKVDYVEGPPLSPKDMGIEESIVGGGTTVESGIPADLRSELKEVFNPSFSTLGHGTRLEKAQEILHQGLRAKHPELASTTIPLFDSSKPYEDQVPQVVEQILHWPHLDEKAVVVVMIPNPQEGEQGGSKYFNSVFQELLEPDTGYNEHYFIPPSYIRGYVDVETKNLFLILNFNQKNQQ